MGIYNLLPITQLGNGAFVQSTDLYAAVDQNDPTQSPAGSTKKYTIGQLQSFLAEITIGSNLQSVTAATTSNLNATYDNGTNGIGATLTNAGTQAALVVDGVSASVGMRLLISMQTIPSQNGIYVVTIVGDGATDWVLTRAGDYDTTFRDPSYGDFVAVVSGSTYALTFWMQTTPNPIIIGTSPISFEEMVNGSSDWVSVTGTSQLVVDNVNYIPLNGSLTTFTLPASCPVGFRFNIEGLGAGGWTIQAGGGQYLRFLSTTSSAGGTASSKLQYDNCAVVCVTANVEFKLMTAGSASIQFT